MAKKKQEEKIAHPRGGSTTKDATDLGAPMTPGEGPQGPEDAMGAEPNRGTYTGRTGGGEHYEMVRVGTHPDGTPIIERRRQS